MSRVQMLQVLGWIWSGFGVYWLIAGSRVKAERTSEPPIYRVVRLSILVLTFTLLFARWTAIGMLGAGFRPQDPVLRNIGFVLAVGGIALAAWARVHLGQFWSDKVVLKVDHRLIRTGPYSRLRHPIYSGVLLGVAGTALVLGEWRGVLAFAILVINYSIKARREDQILAGAFADSFNEHKRRAGFLLPRLRPRN